MRQNELSGLVLPQQILPHAAGHKLVVNVAKEIAATMYEAFARLDDRWYAANPSQDAYVKEAWPLLLEQARATLANLIAQTRDEHLKDEIFDALVKDNAIRSGRGIQISL